MNSFSKIKLHIYILKKLGFSIIKDCEFHEVHLFNIVKGGGGTKTIVCLEY